MEDIGTVDLAVEETAKGRVARLVLSNPKKLNALSPGVVAALTARAGELARDGGLRVVVLSGAGGRAFAAGADLRFWRGWTRRARAPSSPRCTGPSTRCAGCPAR